MSCPPCMYHHQYQRSTNVSTWAQYLPTIANWQFHVKNALQWHCKSLQMCKFITKWYGNVWCASRVLSFNVTFFLKGKHSLKTVSVKCSAINHYLQKLCGISSMYLSWIAALLKWRTGFGLAFLGKLTKLWRISTGWIN